MTYLSECLADSPSVIYPMDTYSSGFADSSGNARHLNVLSGTAPTTTATGPDGVANDAASWDTSPGYLLTTYTQTAPGVGTYELWFRYASAPAVNLRLVNWSPNNGNLGTSSYLTLRSDGKLAFGVFDGSTNAEAVSSSALSTNTWHHVVCLWGTGGQVLRVDKVTVATGAKTAASTAASACAFRVHGQYNGSADSNYTGAVDMAWAAFYPTKLTTTRTDAHYDAMGTPAGASIVAAPFAATASVPAPTVNADASVSVPAMASSAAFGAPAVTGTGDATIAAPAFAASAAVAAPTLSADANPTSVAATATAAFLAPTVGATASATVTAVPFAATADLLAPSVDDGSGSQTVVAAAMAATATLLPPAWTNVIEVATDTSNRIEGLDLVCVGRASVSIPVAVPPAPLPERYDVAIPYPAPVMVDGRPT